VSIHDLRRRFRQAAATHDWLEGVSLVLGGVFFLATVACVWGFAVAVTSLGDPEPGLALQPGIVQGSTEGTVQATRWFGMALFGVLAVLTLAVAWFLTSDALRRAARRFRDR